MVRAEIESALSRCLAAEDFRGIVSAYLFGSHAEGRAHRESDVDVGIILRRGTCANEREIFELRLELVTRLSAAAGALPVDVVMLNDAPPGLARHVVTSGKRFLCADPMADHAFVRDVQLRAADLEPFLRRMRRIKLEAIARP